MLARMLEWDLRWRLVRFFAPWKNSHFHAHRAKWLVSALMSDFAFLSRQRYKSGETARYDNRFDVALIFFRSRNEFFRYAPS